MKIEREGVTLRRWELFDAERLTQIADNKKIYDNLRDYFPHPYTLQDAKVYIESLAGNDRAVVFAIEYEGMTAGNIGVFIQTDVYRKNAEIGYFLAEEFWGKGIMTKAIRAITSYVFANYDVIRIYGEPFARNAGSRKSLEKAGFKLDAVIKRNIIKNGVVEDGCLYSLYNDCDTGEKDGSSKTI